MERVLRYLADGMIVLVGVVVLVVIGIRYTSFFSVTGRVFQPSVEQAVGEQLDPATVGIDFEAGARTLIMVLHSDCQFCQQSMPFYRRVLEFDTADTQVVVATSHDDNGIDDYLASERVEPDALVFVEPRKLPVAGTPTLLLVDGQGLITHAWIGLLNGDREAEVISALFG